MIALMIWFGFLMAGELNVQGNNNSGVIIAIILPLHIMSLIIIIWGISFAAKTLKSIELGRMAMFSDYVGDFFLIWFSVIGYWILQPRINQLIKE
mgnify:CR=1 FL=1